MHIRSLISVMVIGVFIALMSWSPAGSAEFRALPVDEAPKDPSLVDFRARLLAAIVRRDVDYVVAQASSDIHLSFGGHAGRDDFRNFLTLSEDDLADEYKHTAKAQREAYWDDLEDVLRMGGRFTAPDVFAAPYVWTVELPYNLDPFQVYFVITDSAPLRDRPSKYGAVKAMLSHDVVVADTEDSGTRFVKVKTASGQEGYVRDDHLRSYIDYRAVLKKSGGQWRMTLFIAGD